MEPTNKQTNERPNQAEPTRFSFKSIMYICVYCVVIIVFGINKTDIHKIIMSLSILPRAFANLVQFPVFDCIRCVCDGIAHCSIHFYSMLYLILCEWMNNFRAFCNHPHTITSAHHHSHPSLFYPKPTHFHCIWQSVSMLNERYCETRNYSLF